MSDWTKRYFSKFDSDQPKTAEQRQREQLIESNKERVAQYAQVSQTKAVKMIFEKMTPYKNVQNEAPINKQPTYNEHKNEQHTVRNEQNHLERKPTVEANVPKERNTSVEETRRNRVEEAKEKKKREYTSRTKKFQPTPFVSSVHGIITPKTDEYITVQNTVPIQPTVQLREKERTAIPFAPEAVEQQEVDNISQEIAVQEVEISANEQENIVESTEQQMQEVEMALQETPEEEIEDRIMQQDDFQDEIHEHVASETVETEYHPITTVEDCVPVKVEQIDVENSTTIEHTKQECVEDNVQAEKKDLPQMQREDDGTKHDVVKPAYDARKNRPPVNVMMFHKDRVLLERQAHQPKLPPTHLLRSLEHKHVPDEEWMNEQRRVLNVTLKTFGVNAEVVAVTEGPTVTRFELLPEMGVKVNKITSLADDLKLHLSARDIRIEAPIPGKNTVGIEIPNRTSRPVVLKDIIRDPSFIQHPSKLTLALGMDLSGAIMITDIERMPHGLIAGSTGSGKSVCINTLLMSVMFKATPDEVRFMLIDPKMVELMPYNAMPHLVCPVITDVKIATQALKWAVDEMENRYEKFVSCGVRDMNKYNEWCERTGHVHEKMPRLVIIIDELADLMMQAAADVEECIARLAQKARASGIHLIVATQRPSVNVITGLIKANIPTRLSFAVVSAIDSRTVL
ncbi:MAG: DNA translocase FtsK, partial [Bacilli bacterium]